MKISIWIKRFFIFYLPLFVWMGVIFWFSSYGGYAQRQTDLSLSEWLVRKSAHMGEFFILTVLLFRAIWQSLQKKIVWVFFLSGFLSLLYAISDETHQHFVPFRQGKPSDVLIDFIGISLALGLFFVAWRIDSRRNGKKV